MGVVVRARRMRWGFLQHKPRLAFRFSYTTTTDGRVIGLRASPLPTGDPHVVVNRGEKGHAMLWVGGTDVFEAYVDGTLRDQRMSGQGAASALHRPRSTGGAADGWVSDVRCWPPGSCTAAPRCPHERARRRPGQESGVDQGPE